MKMMMTLVTLVALLASAEAKKSCKTTSGKIVQDGWRGMGEGCNYCNQCWCSDGAIGCTQMACPYQVPECPRPCPKPLYCPDVHCDQDEQEEPKPGQCCPVCKGLERVRIPSTKKSCKTRSGKIVKDGWSGKGEGCDYCNQCWCSDGAIGCTQKACPFKAPECPRPTNEYNCLTLDEPAFWSAGKREHCCRTKNMACYKCESREKWSDRKTAWCCANEQKGCPSDEGLRCLTFDLPENWTDEKRSYCCRTRNMTCYKCDTREAWSARKTAWCCANEKKGCPN